MRPTENVKIYPNLKAPKFHQSRKNDGDQLT